MLNSRLIATVLISFILSGCQTSGITDNASIAYFYLSNTQGQQDLIAVSVDGLENRINGADHSVYHPHYLPARNLLVYTGKEGTELSVRLTDLNTGQSTKLTSGENFEQTPRLSPDGTRISFSRQCGMTSCIYTMDADGGNPKPLIESELAVAGGLWSPDGNWIAVAHAKADTGENNQHVVVVSADGSIIRDLTPEQKSTHFDLAWSPDSRRLAYTSRRDRVFDIFVTDIEGKTERNLTNSNAPQSTPFWSPDGRTIIYTGVDSATGRTEVYSYDLESSQILNLTKHASQDETPVYSSSGKLIGFVSYRDGNAEIYAMKANGSDQRRLTQNASHDTFPIIVSDRLPAVTREESEAAQ